MGTHNIYFHKETRIFKRQDFFFYLELLYKQVDDPFFLYGRSVSVGRVTAL